MNPPKGQQCTATLTSHPDNDIDLAGEYVSGHPQHLGRSPLPFQQLFPRHLAITVKMHLLTTLSTTFLLASTSTLALILPENYTIIEVVPIEPEYLYKEAQGNPHVPLIHATLTCGREYTPLYEIYTLVGAHWDGVSRDQLKWAAKQGGLMTDWDYFEFGENECFWRDGGMECPIRPAGWEASVSSFFCQEEYP